MVQRRIVVGELRSLTWASWPLGRHSWTWVSWLLELLGLQGHRNWIQASYLSGLRKTVETLHKTVEELRTIGNKKELEHCIEEQEGCKKMLLELGTIVGQVVNKQVLGDCRKVALELHDVQEQEGCRKAGQVARKKEQMVAHHKTEQLAAEVRKMEPIDGDDDREQEQLPGHHILRLLRECESEHHHDVRDRVRAHPLHKGEKVIA